MTPRRARLALCLFVLLAMAVAHNALVRQTRPPFAQSLSEAAPPALAQQRTPRAPQVNLTERASQSAKDVPDKRTSRPAGPRPAAAGTAAATPPLAAQKLIAPAVERVEITNPDTIRAIERELRQRGYGPLVSDGSLRPATRAAIMAFEFDNGLPLTGQANEILLGRILFGAGAAADPVTAGKVRTGEAQDMVRLVQQSLTSLGYQPGRTDGQLHEATQRAIREFEMDKGLVPKGRVSADLVARLAEPVQPRLSRRP
jgi:peptidoglycan hydrolase-like protein with peptidoglycan-binding domain